MAEAGGGGADVAVPGGQGHGRTGAVAARETAAGRAASRGVNREVVRQAKETKRAAGRMADGRGITLISRQIELHDRAGADFDRIMNRTVGKPDPKLPEEPWAYTTYDVLELLRDRHPFAPGTKLYATPNYHLPVTFYTGIPVGNDAAVRRSYLDGYEGGLVILEAGPYYDRLTWQEIREEATRHGYGHTYRQLRDLAADQHPAGAGGGPGITVAVHP
jgi:hypothetical protein